MKLTALDRAAIYHVLLALSVIKHEEVDSRVTAGFTDSFPGVVVGGARRG